MLYINKKLFENETADYRSSIAKTDSGKKIPINHPRMFRKNSSK